MYRLNTLDTCNLFAFFIVDDVSPWVLASEGRLAAKRSNGKVHVACGRACIGRASDVLRWHGMWRNDGMKNIKRSTITTTYEKPNFWMSSNLSIKRVVSRSRRQKYNSTLNWYKNSTKVRAQKGCDMLRHFPKQTSCSFMDPNSLNGFIGFVLIRFFSLNKKSAPEHKATIALLRDAIALRLTSIPGWRDELLSELRNVQRKKSRRNEPPVKASDVLVCRPLR